MKSVLIIASVPFKGDKHILNTPHLFELCGASGQFTFTQYIPQIYTDQLNALIFLQLDLYSAHQPSNYYNALVINIFQLNIVIL